MKVDEIAVKDPARVLRVWREALVWLATHDRTTLVGARRAQRVAARALYHLEAPPLTAAAAELSDGAGSKTEDEE